MATRLLSLITFGFTLGLLFLGDVQAGIVHTDQGALRGYIGEGVSKSTNFQVTHNTGVLHQTIVLDVPIITPPTPTTPPTTTPVTPTPSGSAPTFPVPTPSTGGSSEKYDASSWILERKYEELVKKREEEQLYTSAPEEEVPTDVELAPTAPTNFEKPQEEIKTPEEKPSQPPIEQPALVVTETPQEKSGTFHKSKNKATTLLSENAELVFDEADALTLDSYYKTREDFFKSAPKCPSFWRYITSCWFCWFPWILLIIAILYALCIRKKYKETLEELDEIQEELQKKFQKKIIKHAK